MSLVNDKKFISQGEWVRLPQRIRDGLRKAFNVQKSGYSKMATGVGGHDYCLSDGCEPADLMAALSIEKVLAYLGQTYEPKSRYDYDQLFQVVLRKLFPQDYAISQANEIPAKESKAHGLADFPKADSVNPPNIIKIGETDEPKKKGRPRKYVERTVTA